MLLRKKIYFIVALSVHENFYDAAKSSNEDCQFDKNDFCKNYRSVTARTTMAGISKYKSECAYELTQYKLL